jgi:diguanylate cyclase (GGDEF)-like protein
VEQFLRWLSPIVLAFGALYLLAGEATGQASLRTPAVAAFVYALVLLVARRLQGAGRMHAAIGLTSVGLVAAGFAVVLVERSLYPALAVLPPLAALFALPFVSRRSGALLGGAWAASALLVAMGEVGPAGTGPSVAGVLGAGAMVAALALLLLLLHQHDRRLRRNLEETRAGQSRLGQALADLREREAQLRDVAYHDNLTGLPNRLMFYERLDQARRQADGEGHRFAVVFIDLDGFKAVNDRFGHGLGDALLQAVAERLRGAVRGGDTVARLGGDEFTVLLRGVGDEGHAVQIARKLLETLRAPFDVHGQQVHLSGSAGVTLGHAGGTDPEQVVKRADAAMYRAKDAGRGIVLVEP